MNRAVLLAVLSACLLALQRGVVRAQDHPEVPASCNNYSTTPNEHKCGCGKAMHHDCDQPAPSVTNDSKCRTNCKPERCKCVSACMTHH